MVKSIPARPFECGRRRSSRCESRGEQLKWQLHTVGQPERIEEFMQSSR
jgi:hypothetical protein